jgi:hypothetical protein
MAYGRVGVSERWSGGVWRCGGVAVWRCGGVACGIVGVRRERFDPTFQTRGWLDLSRRYRMIVARQFIAWNSSRIGSRERYDSEAPEVLPLVDV